MTIQSLKKALTKLTHITQGVGRVAGKVSNKCDVIFEWRITLNLLEWSGKRRGFSPKGNYRHVWTLVKNNKSWSVFLMTKKAKKETNVSNMEVRWALPLFFRFCKKWQKIFNFVVLLVLIQHLLLLNYPQFRSAHLWSWFPDYSQTWANNHFWIATNRL